MVKVKKESFSMMVIPEYKQCLKSINHDIKSLKEQLAEMEMLNQKGLLYEAMKMDLHIVENIRNSYTSLISSVLN
jgi:hypothetical protein